MRCDGLKGKFRLEICCVEISGELSQREGLGKKRAEDERLAEDEWKEMRETRDQRGDPGAGKSDIQGTRRADRQKEEKRFYAAER